MATGKHTRFLLGVTVAVVLPFSFYIIAKVLKKDQLHMPRYFIADSVSGKDTMYHKVSEVDGINQFGDHVALNKDLQGRALAIDFFFTNCPSVCPRLTQNMKLLEAAFKRTPMARNDTLVQLISITVDPARDTFQALRAYANRYGVDGNRWWFITGDKKKLYDWARSELHLSVPDGNGGVEDFIHTEQIVLLDKDRNIRGYYNGLDTLDVGRCANDIALLSMEKKHKK